MVSRLLLAENHEVAIIELNHDRVMYLSRELKGRVMVVEGNCCVGSALRDAGIENADFFCALTGQDDDNLASSEIAKTLFDIPRVLARVNNPRNERIFTNLGIQEISSTDVVARRIEQEILSSTSRAVLTLRQGEYAMIEVEIPNSASLRAEGGRRVSELELPPSTVLVSVAHGDQFDTVNGRTILMPGDTVLMCTSSENEEDARRALLEL